MDISKRQGFLYWGNGGGGDCPPHQQKNCPFAPPLNFIFISPTPKVNSTIIKYQCSSYDPIKSFLAVVIVVIGGNLSPTPLITILGDKGQWPVTS